jgi:hypothetical protein
MPHRHIHSEADLDRLFALFAAMKLPITVEWVQGRDRTADQNALQWLWATEAARQLGDRTPDEMQREWKLRHGVPILREDSAEFRAFYDKALRPRSYADKLEAMRFVPVTSELKVRQMVRFLDEVQRECAEQGVILTDPDPELASYHQRYRLKDAA